MHWLRILTTIAATLTSVNGVAAAPEPANPVVVSASGDLAAEEGTWTWSNPNPDGTMAQDNGKYLVAWKKTNGTWLMQTDIWNSDNAPPQAAAK